ncbi:MAG: large conductance mechanosensitive channel protein MscL, partial [Anaerolineales bacterium]|nr:large conductance mechanosensitive channel protein MscL [Anaerolineales bacterium]
ISFLIVALAMFLLIRAINRLQEGETEEDQDPAPTSRECPFCFTAIPTQATRCPHCTSQLK